MLSSNWVGKESLFLAVNPPVLYETGLQEWLIWKNPLLDLGITMTGFFGWFFVIVSGKFSSSLFSYDD